jgi:very-short-patch-repair endonuclease
MPRASSPIAFARQLRRAQTPTEQLVWSLVRDRRLGVKFRRQHPCGRFVLDFVCLERGLVVEVDGEQHAESPYDAKRDAWLAAEGLRVLRVYNPEVVCNLDGVREAILEALGAAPHPR